MKSPVYEHTKEVIAIFWVIISAAVICYIVYVFGYKTEILTLMIGYLTGTLQNIVGTYFSSTPSKKTPEAGAPGSTTADVSITATTTPSTTAADTKDVKVEGFTNRSK